MILQMMVCCSSVVVLSEMIYSDDFTLSISIDSDKGHTSLFLLLITIIICG